MFASEPPRLRRPRAARRRPRRLRPPAREHRRAPRHPRPARATPPPSPTPPPPGRPCTASPTSCRPAAPASSSPSPRPSAPRSSPPSSAAPCPRPRRRPAVDRLPDAAPMLAGNGEEHPMATATVNGVRLYYEMRRLRPALVLVHGSWGSHRNWDPVVPALARRHEVIAYDRRGHSDSERPDGQGSVGEDAADLARAHRAPRPRPGLGRRQLLRRHDRPPPRRRPPRPRPRPHRPRAAPLRAPRRRSRHRARSSPRAAGASPPWPTASPPATTPAPPSSSSRPSPSARAPGPSSRRRCARSSSPTRRPSSTRPATPGSSPSTSPASPPPPPPILLTTGDRSPPIFAPVVARLAAALPRAETHRFPDAGHIPHATHPEAWVTVARDFIARHEAA